MVSIKLLLFKYCRKWNWWLLMVKENSEWFWDSNLGTDNSLVIWSFGLKEKAPPFNLY